MNFVAQCEDMKKFILVSVLFMLCTAMKLRLVVGDDLPMTFPYTLQATPITFTEEPQSMSVLRGTTVSLSCNTTILQNSNYRLPELKWCFNGQLLNGSQPSHFQIHTYSSNRRSELTVMGVSQRDSGYYECVALDGYHLLEGGEPAYIYTVASQRAQLKVIDVDLSVSEEVESVSVALGKHLLLSCETGAVYPPAQSTWRKDGIQVTGEGNEVVLGNGSLLILGAMEETEGSYQCTGYYSQEPLNSTTYNVSLIQGGPGAGQSSPIVIIDGPAGVIEVGEWLNLTCYTLNSEGLQLQWLKDGQILSATEKLLAVKASVNHSGTYTCQLVSSSAVLATSDLNVIIAHKPVVELRGCTLLKQDQLCGDDAVRQDSYSDHTIKLTCNTSDPRATIYWYKNGQNISSGSTLRYHGKSSDDLLGVYQCFAETPAGMNYNTVRVIRTGFTNPPANFTCQVVDQRLNITRPSVILSWDRPTLQAFPVGTDGIEEPPKEASYMVVFEADGVNHSVTVDAENTATVVDLPMDGHYTFRVYFDHNDEKYPITAISMCENDTFIRRIAVPRRLMVSCPDPESIPTSDNDTNITIPVQWISPVKKPVINSVVIVNFKSVCLHGNTTQTNVLLDGYHKEEDDEKFNLEVGPLLPGSVCLFGGWYYLDLNFVRVDVPSESCAVPVQQSTGKAQLQLTCSDSVAAVEVVTPDGDVALNSTNLVGKCVSVDWEARFDPLTEYYLEAGNTTISGLPNDTICNFYGSYRLQTSEVVDFEPVQCIMNRPSPTIPLPQTTTGDITTTTTTTSAASNESATTTTYGDKTTVTDTLDVTKSGAGSGFSLSPAALTWVAVDLSLALLVIVVLVIACFAWRSYSRKLIKERKKQLHIWDDFLTQQEGEDNLDQDPHVLPQFPYVSRDPDSLSISTEVDYLYKEEGRTVLSHTSLSSLMKSMKNDEKAIDSPKLIMDRFLNGCHQRVWESSHESLSNVPPSPIREQGSSKLAELHCAETDATYESTNPVLANSNLASDSGNVMARHYTIPLQVDFSNRLAVDSYIPSGGSSGYGTCSDHYFESGSSTYTSSTNDYFRSRLADVAECTSLSTCGEEEQGQQTSMVDVTKHSKDSCYHPMLVCEMSSDSEVTPCSSTDIDKDCLNRAHKTHVMTLPVKSTSNHRFGSITTQCAGHTNCSVTYTCTNSDLNNRHRDFTPSSIPPEHYFTDDEGYLRFSKETSV